MSNMAGSELECPIPPSPVPKKKGGRPNFTYIDRSKATRVVPMEVLVLGMSKTGTSSMKQALLDLGYSDVYHMTSILTQNPRDADLWVKAFEACYAGKGEWGKKEWDALLGHCMAVTDTPAICFTHELIEAYPDAKVVLLTRDIDAWFESYADTVGAYFLLYKSRYMNPWSIQNYLMPKWQIGSLFQCYFKYCDEAWMSTRGKKYYLDQAARVRSLVPKESGRLLEFDVREGWEPLCSFLGKEVPKDGRPFPKIMERDEFRETSKNVRIYEMILMATNVAKKLGMLSVLGAVWWVGRRQGLFAQ